MLNPDRYIYKIEESDSDNPDLKMFEIGWYFVNEAEQFEGPYSSRQEAIDSMALYVKWLNQGE